MDQITVVAGPPGSEVPVVVDAGTKGVDIVEQTPDLIAVMINGAHRDLDTVLTDGDTVSPIILDSPDGLAIMRHSTTHVLAQAVQALYPETRLGTGPAIENGFYYDFDAEQSFTPEDLKKIEKRMRKIVAQNQSFQRRVVATTDAVTELAAEPLKIELIEEHLVAPPGDDDPTVLTIYDNVDTNGNTVWCDLCRGPHVPTTKFIKALKLQSVAAAYWRGSEKNQQLQRIYGTAWNSEEDLQAHLHMLEEAAKRDHRKLGAELDLFSFPPEIGSGLAVFHPKGGAIRRVMEDYSRTRHERAGYSFVNSPHITKSNLFETSGHLEWFADGMFPPMHMDDEDYYLKPMNCPFHIMIYKAQQHSYRELPLRYAEFGTVYRYEKSGVLHGLTRVRGMTQDDAHIFCTKEQMTGELKSLLTFVVDVLRDYGLDDFYVELSTRDDIKEKFVGDQSEWDEATEALREAAEDSGLTLVPDPGGAAFYGPKISVQVRDAIGRTWQMSTIQLDFQFPKRFDMEYTAADGTRQRPVMIHRALFGSIERFFGVLLEHYAGAFPPWLAPVQVTLIPIAEDHHAYAQAVADRLFAEGVRVEVDTSDSRMQKKIRNAQTQKVPYMLIVGDDDIAASAVSIRYRSGEQKNGLPVDEAVAEILATIEAREQI